MEDSLKRLQEAQRQLERQKLEAERLIQEGRRAALTDPPEQPRPLNDPATPKRIEPDQ
jgi:hypothetical protein